LLSEAKWGDEGEGTTRHEAIHLNSIGGGRKGANQADSITGGK